MIQIKKKYNGEETWVCPKCGGVMRKNKTLPKCLGLNARDIQKISSIYICEECGYDV